MEIPSAPLDATTGWVRVTPCARAALETLRQCLLDREDAGGRLAVEGLGLFSIRRAGAIEAYLSPGAALALAAWLDGLATAPSMAPPDHPALKLEVGDVGLWKSVVRPPSGVFLAA